MSEIVEPRETRSRTQPNRTLVSLCARLMTLCPAMHRGLTGRELDVLIGRVTALPVADQQCVPSGERPATP